MSELDDVERAQRVSEIMLMWDEGVRLVKRAALSTDFKVAHELTLRQINMRFEMEQALRRLAGLHEYVPVSAAITAGSFSEKTE